MTPVESLYFAIGQLAYAVAFSDGEVQKEEREKFQAIVTEGLKDRRAAYDVSDIIFQILERDKVYSHTAYEWALKEVKANSHYLSPDLKATFVTVMEKVAAAFPPITLAEFRMLQNFKKELSSVEGDPVYYNASSWVA